MYLYETHLHTSPVSLCARVGVRDTVEFYKNAGYEGIFITNHFIDGNMRGDRALPYNERIEYFCSDYESAVEIGKEVGLSVFFGAELSYGGSDFLIYGLDKKWYLDHPEIEKMSKSQELSFMISEGALVIHAHPFREASYIDHIRLFPRCVHGVEIYNANRTDFENEMARQYAENYQLLTFAGSDNHSAGIQNKLAGMQSDSPIKDELDFVNRVKNGEMKIFTRVIE